MDEEQAKRKAESWCAYQERSQYETAQKLYEWELKPAQVNRIIAELIETNFLNEERFAAAYTLGKFRIKGWGRIRIRQGLKLKRVPAKMIEKALGKIDEDDYIAKLRMLLEKKAALLNERDSFRRKYKLSRYAMQKGYEAELIKDILAV